MGPGRPSFVCLRQNSPTIRVTTLSVQISGIWCIHNVQPSLLCSSRTFLSTPKETSYHLSCHSQFPLPPVSGFAGWFIQMEVFDVGPQQLASFIQHGVFEAHPCVSYFILFMAEEDSPAALLKQMGGGAWGGVQDPIFPLSRALSGTRWVDVGT